MITWSIIVSYAGLLGWVLSVSRTVDVIALVAFGLLCVLSDDNLIRSIKDTVKRLIGSRNRGRK